MVNYPLWTREQAYEILNRTTINALGTYGFREKFLQEINSLVSKYSKNGHQKNGKNILERLDDLVFIVYTKKRKKIPEFNDDIYLLSNLLERAVTDSSMIYTINHPPEKVEKRKYRTNTKKRKKIDHDFNILDIYYKEVKNIPCSITSLRGLSKEEKAKVIESVKEKINKCLNNVEAEKTSLFRLFSENEVFYSVFEKYLESYKVILSRNNWHQKILRNCNKLQKEVKLKRIKDIEQLLFDSCEKVHAISDDDFEKKDSVCYNLAENIVAIINSKLLDKIADILLIRYNNLWKLKNIENNYKTKNKAIPQKLTVMIESRRKKIESKKTVEELLNDRRDLYKHRNNIINERIKISRSLLRFGIYKAHKFFKNNGWIMSDNSEVLLEDLIQETNLSTFNSTIIADPKRGSNFLAYIHQSANRSMSTLANKLCRAVSIGPEAIGQIIKYASIKNKNIGITDNEIKEIMNVSQTELEEIKVLCEKSFSLHSPLGKDSEGSLEKTIPDKGKDALEEIIKSEKSEKIREAISELKGEYAKILMLRYYSDSGDPMTLDEIGKKVGTGRENIRQKEEKALKQLGKKLEMREITV